MTQGFIARAQQRLLSKLGEGALLRGVDAGNVHLEHDVELSPGDPGRSDDNHVVRYSVATILSDYAPKTGDLLTHPDGNFRLDRLVADTRYTRRFILVKV